jgi:hypothetical protein
VRRGRAGGEAGQAAVVGRPATSMLSFTAKGTPSSGCVSNTAGPVLSRRASQASACAISVLSGNSEIHAALDC